MAITLKDLLAQKQALEAQIAKLKATEQADAIEKVHKLIEENQLTQDDIFPRATSGKSRKAPKTKVAAKYRDAATGSEWTGRGRQPSWLKNRNKEDFLIA